MRRKIAIILYLILSTFLIAACGGEADSGGKVTLSVSGTAGGQELDLMVDALRRFMNSNPDIEVHVRPTPREYQPRFSTYRQLLESGSPDIDVYQIDVVWTKAFAPHGLDLMSYLSDQELRDHFPVIVQNNTVDGKLIGLPFFTDAPVLYYRTDLLQKYGYENPPQTWDELTEMASKIQGGERNDGNLGFWGYVWQGRPYEGLTCNALEWQVAHGGGNILDEEGRPAFNNPQTAEAFTKAAGWVNTISPPSVIEFDEEDSRVIWQRGDAAFMRNWSYAYALSKATAIGGKFDVTPMPRGPGGSAAVLGGWQLMVSKYSRHPEEAVNLVKFLVSESEQKTRAVTGSQNPTLVNLYSDSDILKTVPFFRNFDVTMENVVRRPAATAGEKYAAVSEAYWTAVHSILKGGNAKQALAAGEQRVAEILGVGGGD